MTDLFQYNFYVRSQNYLYGDVIFVYKTVAWIGFDCVESVIIHVHVYEENFVGTFMVLYTLLYVIFSVKF